MKLDARRVAGFLRDPGPCRLVLLYGEDEGLIREQASALTRAVAGSLNDPFRVVELTREGWSSIPAEAAAISMIGGRRVIRVRDATDAIVGAAAEALRGQGDALIVLEAVGLAKGKLRTLAESHADAASIACYPEEGNALEGVIRSLLATDGASAEEEAIAFLAAATGGDRGVVRGETQKLAMLVGSGGRVTLDLARQVAGDSAGASADAALLAATQGDGVGADAALERAMADGLTGIAVLRALLWHLQRLHQARMASEAGMSVSEAVRALRPPVFFKALNGFMRSVELWPSSAIVSALEEVRQTEIACKQTGARPELLVRRMVAALARQAAARRVSGTGRAGR